MSKKIIIRNSLDLLEVQKKKINKDIDDDKVFFSNFFNSYLIKTTFYKPISKCIKY